MKRAVGGRVEDGAAEKEQEWNVAIREGRKIFGCGNVEVERAGNLHVNDGGVSGECRDYPVDVCPEEAAEGLAPAVRLAEEIEHLLLLTGRIAAARDFDLDLAAQGYGVNRLIGYGILDLQLERDHGNSGEGNDAGGVNLEGEIRH